jgi:hypothetical protein
VQIKHVAICLKIGYDVADWFKTGLRLGSLVCSFEDDAYPLESINICECIDELRDSRKTLLCGVKNLTLKFIS